MVDFFSDLCPSLTSGNVFDDSVGSLQFMKQIVQSMRSGRLTVASVPDPLAQPHHVLIANAASVISAGTEKMTMDLARKSLLGKAMERPDQVRRVLEKLRNEGLMQTLAQVRGKLDEPMPMGYSSAGVVLACGDGVQSFKPGDRVAGNGPHAGVVCVPQNLCARAPDNVPLEHAAFAVLAAIAMQGIRLSRAVLGETVLVVGLGLIGQLTVALLNAAGIRVLATDLDQDKCDLAVSKMGADEAKKGISGGHVTSRTNGLGADAVIITAATKSKAPMDLAVEAVRQKGRIVLVGVVGLELDRRPFYFKEAEFVVSCSYGPGRYDPDYEDRGHDYPPAYVRWTEQRNIQAALDLMGSGRLDVSPLITHRFPIEQAEQAYNLIESKSEPYLGIVLQYPEVTPESRESRIELRAARTVPRGDIRVGCIGVGNFARTVLLPAIRKVPGLYPRLLCSAKGLSAYHTGDKLGFESVTADEDEVFAANDVDVVFIATQHDQHARQVVKALTAGKHVYVEKPLALTVEEIAEIEAALEACSDPKPLLMVGFNRRFSPAAKGVHDFFEEVSEPITVSIRFNAGPIPADHWTQVDEVGGGRIIGEACHALDLATYLTGSVPVRVFAESIGGPTAPQITDDQCFITVRHANGSVSSTGYLAGGDKAFPKERVEVFGGGRVAVIDDFRDVTLCSRGKITKQKSRSQDKGHAAEIRQFADALLRGQASPISWTELRSVSLASLLAVRSIREGMPFELR